MHHLRFFATIVSATVTALALPPAMASAASWQTATATSVSAGVNSKSTFVIQAYVTLPSSCDAARIRTYGISSQLHRSFIVEQMQSSSSCTPKPVYKCTVVSPSFGLPIPHAFEGKSKGKTWQVHLAMEAPTPIEPMCRKS
jgi:hypothetical protein